MNAPCLRFSWPDASDDHLERVSHILADMICPILLDTVIKGSFVPLYLSVFVVIFTVTILRVCLWSF